MGVDILWAEDDRNDRRLIRAALDDADFDGEVEFVEDGSALLARLQGDLADRPRLVVLDLRMSPMDGLPCLRTIRETPHLADLPVAIFTSGQVSDEMAECQHLGAQFVVKPSEFASFAAAVQALVRPPNLASAGFSPDSAIAA